MNKGHSRGRVLKQPIIRVEHLLRDQEEPLPGHAPVVQPFLRLELDPETRLQKVRLLQGHDASVGLLKYTASVQLHLETVRNVSLGKNTHKHTHKHEHTHKQCCSVYIPE